MTVPLLARDDGDRAQFLLWRLGQAHSPQQTGENFEGAAIANTAFSIDDSAAASVQHQNCATIGERGVPRIE